MARTVTNLTIFVSCPSDLEPERHAIQRVVESVNRSIRGTHDIQFEIWHWKDDAIPGVAETGQDQIDSQIPKHDVFLGMMWKRFGTPTKGSGSGTEHELRNSLEAHRSQNEPKYVIFGFKTGIDSLDDLDPVEFGKIATFRKELGNEGILYTTFGATTEFEKLLNINLTKIALSWTKESFPAGAQQKPQTDSPPTPEAPDEEEDELGLLDFLEITEDSMAEATAEIGRIGDALTGMGSSLGERAEAMSAAKGSDGQIPVKLARMLSNQAADDMVRFSKLASPMVGNAESKFEEAIEAMTNALSVQKSFSEGEVASDEIEDLDNTLAQLLGSLDGADDGLNEMRDQVVSLPKLSARFNRARKDVIGFLDSYSRMSTKVRSLTGNVRQALQSLKQP